MELISVIIPIYNVEQYLDQCIKSIIDQTYRELEIILVDDGSSDKCPLICDDWGVRDNRIKVIHKKNGGLSDARNEGLKLANGEYIAFVDSDDWINIKYIEYLYTAIKKEDADIAACDIQKVKNDLEPFDVYQKSFKIERFTSKEAIKDILHNRRFRTVVWNKLFKRKILHGELFEIGRLHEDEFFSYRIYDKAKSLVYIDIPLYYYRQRADSIMSTFSLRHLDVIDAFCRRIKFLERKYPDLATKDKINFCSACINLYSLVPKVNKKEAVIRIQNCRKQIHFSYKEFFGLSHKEKYYVVISNKWLIEIGRLLKTWRRNV